MEYIECPNTYYGDLKKVFIAGGITGCSDWQSHLVKLLSHHNIAILNPRRADFPIHDPDAAVAQITWEYTQMIAADVISFWFCPETLNPIVLYELGLWMKNGKPIVIGSDRKYQRLSDVVIQTRLARPDIKIVYSLKTLAKQIMLALA